MQIKKSNYVFELYHLKQVQYVRFIYFDGDTRGIPSCNDTHIKILKIKKFNVKRNNVSLETIK